MWAAAPVSVGIQATEDRLKLKPFHVSYMLYAIYVQERLLDMLGVGFGISAWSLCLDINLRV